jgi:hypothetical protein
MKGDVNNVVRSGGNTKKAGIVTNNSIDVLERNLQKAIVERKTTEFRYDELVGESNIGMVYNRVKPVRNEEGKIDVYTTFMNARKRNGGL